MHIFVLFLCVIYKISKSPFEFESPFGIKFILFQVHLYSAKKFCTVR